MDKIDLTKDEIIKLKEIGSGTEGRVFKYDNNYLIKIYRPLLKNILKNNPKFDKYIKIYNKDNIKINNNSAYFNYFISNGEEDIRVRNKDGLKKAIARQKYIKYSTLPIDIVYINGLFAGCLLKKIDGIQIHKLTGMPIKFKRKIIKNVLIEIEELLDNYIYHTDIDNSPHSISYYLDNNNFPRAKKGHSHILVNPITLNTNIIDLDGKSTTYMERYNYNLEQKCLITLTRLIIEFLFKIDTDEIKEDDEIYFELLKLGLENNTAYKLSNRKFESIKELKKELKITF